MSTTTKTNTETVPDLDKLRAAVAEGERAEALLAEKERARQERNSAALAEAQRAWAVDVCNRAPDLDTALAGQRREAVADLDAAVERGDLGGALAAWRVEAAARFTQRTLNSVWHEAWATCGVGTAPREPSVREADVDEALKFTTALDGAADRSARNAAAVLGDDLVPEKPTMAPDELPPGAGVRRHLDACPDPSRVEVSEVPSGHRSHGTVVHCLGCGVSEVLVPAPVEPEAERARRAGQYVPGEVRPSGAWS